jgi:hypothetical protein
MNTFHNHSFFILPFTTLVAGAITAKVSGAMMPIIEKRQQVRARTNLILLSPDVA